MTNRNSTLLMFLRSMCIAYSHKCCWFFLVMYLKIIPKEGDKKTLTMLISDVKNCFNFDSKLTLCFICTKYASVCLKNYLRNEKFQSPKSTLRSYIFSKLQIITFESQDRWIPKKGSLKNPTINLNFTIENLLNTTFSVSSSSTIYYSKLIKLL